MALMTMIELSTKNEITTKDVIKLFSFLTRDTSLIIFDSLPSLSDFLGKLMK